MTLPLAVCCAIVLGTLLVVWRRAHGGMATLAPWLLLPCALPFTAHLGKGLVQELEIRNAIYLGTLLLVATTAKCALRLASGATLTALVKQLRWTDLALVLAFASFAAHYLCLRSLGLLNQDHMELTTFDFSAYRMVRNGSLIDFDTYDVDLIKASGTRYYVAFCLWVASFWAKTLAVANPLIAHPIWFYLRTTRISIYVTQALFLLGAYWVGRRMFSPVAGIIAMLLLGLSGSGFDIAFSVRDDYPVLVLGCLGICAYLRYRAQPSARRLFWTGVVAGCGLAFRLTILPILLGIAGDLFWTALREKPFRPRALARQLLFFAVVFLGPCVLWFLLSKPHRFYWPSLFERGQQDLQFYLGWSDLLGEKYRPVMALPLHERFSILVELFQYLFDRNTPLLVCGGIALAYYIIVRRSSLVAFLTLGNLAFWVLLCWFPEPLQARLSHYLLVTGLLFCLVVGGFLAVDLPARLEALLLMIGRRRFVNRGIPLGVAAAIFLMMLLPLIRQGRIVEEFEKRWRTDFARVQQEMLARIPFGSSILINEAAGDCRSGTVPNPNIYETYGADPEQVAVAYMVPLTEYFVNPGVGSAYDMQPKDPLGFPEWMACVETFRNERARFPRRRSIYETYSTKRPEPAELVGTAEAASKWRFLFNEDLYLSTTSEEALTVSVAQGRQRARHEAPAAQPSGIGFFRKRFNYNIRVPARSEYDDYWNGEGAPAPLARAAMTAIPQAGELSLSPDPPDAPGVIEAEGSRAFTRFTSRRHRTHDAHVTSSRIAVAADTTYRLAFDLRAEGVYRVNPIVHEFSADEPQQRLDTLFEPFPVSDHFQEYEVLYRATPRAKEISIDLEVHRPTAKVDIRDIRVWPKGAARAFDVAKAARVISVDQVKSSTSLALDFSVSSSEDRGQVNLEVIWESHEGLMIGRSIYHLFNSGLRVWDSTEYLSDRSGVPRSVKIPLWKDFEQKSPYGSLVHFVKLYVMAATPRGASMDVAVRRMDLLR